jgi:hypothetical protein
MIQPMGLLNGGPFLLFLIGNSSPESCLDPRKRSAIPMNMGRFATWQISEFVRNGISELTSVKMQYECPGQ